jgi:uncharacterized protein (DUF427 family)
MRWPDPFVEPTPRRLRVRLGGALLADSRRALLLVRYGPTPDGGFQLPTYLLPPEDVRPGVLTDPVEGPDGRRTWTVVGGGVPVPAAAWTETGPGPAGYVTFSWSRLEWFEEDERVWVHARDPYKRVDALHSSRHVRVSVDGVALADSVRPVLLFETSLPTRYYLPAEDVRRELLTPSDTVSVCPYKGRARYWSVRAGDAVHPDLVWSYPDPVAALPVVRDRLCFFDERVDVEVDGVPVARPESPWSDPVGSVPRP